MSTLVQPIAGVASGGSFTLYPSAQAGGIYAYSEASYAEARAGSGIPPTASPGSGNIQVNQSPYDSDPETGGPWVCSKGYFDFDLSTVVGTVATAVLSPGIDTVWGSGWTMEARIHDWGTTLTAADWVPGASLAAKTLLATLTAAASSPASYVAMTESGTALRTAVSAGGILRLVLALDRERLNLAPGSFEGLVINGYNHVTLKPKLVVTTT